MHLYRLAQNYRLTYCLAFAFVASLSFAVNLWPVLWLKWKHIVFLFLYSVRYEIYGHFVTNNRLKTGRKSCNTIIMSLRYNDYMWWVGMSHFINQNQSKFNPNPNQLQLKDTTGVRRQKDRRTNKLWDATKLWIITHAQWGRMWIDSTNTDFLDFS